jgi:hypothetical protein
MVGLRVEVPLGTGLAGSGELVVAPFLRFCLQSVGGRNSSYESKAKEIDDTISRLHCVQTCHLGYLGA